MMSGKAYILDSVNRAIYFDKNKAYIISPAQEYPYELTGYEWSQIVSLKPEFNIVDTTDFLNLNQEIEKNNQKSLGLEFALEIMDSNLSLEYKQDIAILLSEIISAKPEIKFHVANRLFSTIIPASFNPESAYSILLPVSEETADLFKDLRLKSICFSNFYTLFKLKLNSEPDVEEIIEQSLTDQGCYAEFTNALFERSEKKFDSAIITATLVLKRNNVVFRPDLFLALKNELESIHSIILTDNKLKDLHYSDESINIEQENDFIVTLIQQHLDEKERQHDKKYSKRGEGKKIKKYSPDTEFVVENLRGWIKNSSTATDSAFLSKFRELLQKQLHSSQPEHICKTCCDLADHCISLRRYELSSRLIMYSKLFNIDDPVIYNQEAELFRKMRLLDKALTQYDFVISKFPDSVVALNGKAETLRDLGRLDDALVQYESAIRKFPDSVVALSGKAETLRDLGRFNDALAQYQSAISKFPDSVVALSGKAETLKDLGRFDDALAQYESAISKFPDSVFALNGKAETLRDLGRFNDALAQYESAISKFPDSVVALNGKAETLRDLGRFDDALAEYESAISKFPGDVVALNGKAETLRDLGRFNDALAQYESAISKFPGDVVALNGKAETLRDLGRFNDALAQYESAISKFSGDVVALNGKAETLRDLGRFDDALAQYESAISKFPDSVVALNGKAETLRNLGRFDDALAQYESAISKFPDSVVALSGKAETLKDLGRFDDALAQYESAISKFPGDVVVLSGKAETLRGLGRFREALNFYETILHKYSSNRFAQTGKYKLLLELDQLDRHLSELVKPAYISLHDYFDLHIYSVYLIRKGEWDTAQKMLGIGLRSPFRQNKPYFKGLYSYLKILRKEYATALSFFNPNEENKPVENLLATHAYAALNQIENAKHVLHKLDNVTRPVIKTTLSYISERYSLNGFIKTGKPADELDALITIGEMKVLLDF